MKKLFAALWLGLPLGGCAVVTVVDTAVSVTATVVETAVDVTAAVVGGAVDLVTDSEPKPTSP